MGGAERDRHVAGRERRERAAEQVPAQRLRVARQARGLDGAVEQRGRVRHPPGDVQDVAEDGDEDRGDLALAGDLRDGQPALRVRSGRRVAVQVELGRREVRERVQAQADLLVGHRVDERRRRGAVPTRLRDGGEDRGRECEHGRARGRERGHVELGRRAQRAHPPRPHRLVVDAVEVADGEQDHELDRLRRRRARPAVERCREPRARGLVMTEELLEARARADEPDARAVLRVGRQRDALQEGRPAVLEPPGRRVRPGERGQQLDPVAGSRVLRQEPECDPEPARGALRRAPRRREPRLPQHRDGLQVAGPGGVLDVVRPCGRRRTAGRQRAGGAFVRAQAGAERARPVDGAADERVAEAEAPRDVRRPDEVAARAARRAPAGPRGRPSPRWRSRGPGRTGRRRPPTPPRGGGRARTARRARPGSRPRSPRARRPRRPPTPARGRARPGGRAGAGRTGCRRWPRRGARPAPGPSRRRGRGRPRARAGRASGAGRRRSRLRHARWRPAATGRPARPGTRPRSRPRREAGGGAGGPRARARRRRPSAGRRARGRAGGGRPGARGARGRPDGRGSAPRRSSAGRTPGRGRARTGTRRRARRGPRRSGGRTRAGPATRGTRPGRPRAGRTAARARTPRRSRGRRGTRGPRPGGAARPAARSSRSRARP